MLLCSSGLILTPHRSFRCPSKSIRIIYIHPYLRQGREKAQIMQGGNSGRGKINILKKRNRKTVLDKDALTRLQSKAYCKELKKNKH